MAISIEGLFFLKLPSHSWNVCPFPSGACWQPFGWTQIPAFHLNTQKHVE